MGDDSVVQETGVGSLPTTPARQTKKKQKKGVHNFTRKDMKRLMRRGGILRTSLESKSEEKEILQETRANLKQYLGEVLHAMTTRNNANTMTGEHVQDALEFLSRTHSTGNSRVAKLYR